MTQKLPKITVERKKFDALLAKLIAKPPISKVEISEKIHSQSRKRPLTGRLLQK